MDFFKKFRVRGASGVELEATELKEWLEVNSGEFLKSTNQKIRQVLSDIEDYKFKMAENLYHLEKQELSNLKLTPRDLHVLEGNRINYLVKSRAFLSNLELPRFDYNDIGIFQRKFEESLNEYTNATTTWKNIMTTYFGPEMTEILTNFKNMDNKVQELYNLLSGSELRQYKQLFSKIRELNESIIQNEVLSNNLEQLTGYYNELKGRQNYLQEKVEKLKSSRDYAELQALENEKVQVEEKIKDFKPKSQEHKEMQQRLTGLMTRMEKLTVVMDLKELEYQLDHTQAKLQKIDDEISEKKNLVRHINVVQKTKKLETSLEAFARCNVKILTKPAYQE